MNRLALFFAVSVCSVAELLAAVASPEISGICPAATTIGDPSLTLTVTGNYFPTYSYVRLTDRRVPTIRTDLRLTAVSSTSLTGTVAPTFEILRDMDVAIATGSVENNESFILTQQPATLRVYPAPVIASVQPLATTAGLPLNLTVRGETFFPETPGCGAGTELRWNEVEVRTTDIVSPGTITATVPASRLTVGPNTVTVYNRGNGRSVPVTVTVNAAPAVTAAPPDGLVGVAYSAQLTVSGGTAPFNWSLASGQLPPGLQLSAAGVLSGTPLATGVFGFTVRLQDAAGAAASGDLRVRIFQADSKPVIQTLCPTATTVGDPNLIVTLTVPGTFRPALAWDNASVEAAVVNGVGSMTLTARIDPKLTSAGGPHRLTVTNLETKSQLVSDAAIFLVLPPPTIGSITPAPITEGASAQLDITATNVAPLAAACASSAAVEINGRALPITSVTDGHITVDLPAGLVRAPKADLAIVNPGGGRSATSFVVNPPPVILSTSLPVGLAGRPYPGATLAAAGGTAPLRWTLTATSGLSIDANTGTISGTPGVAGVFDLLATVRDNFGVTASQTLRVQVLPTLQMSFSGLPAAIAPGAGSADQPAFQLQVETAGGYPAALSGRLDIAFDPDPLLNKNVPVLADRHLSVGPEFSLAALSKALSAQLQPGTSAGRITITASNLTASGIDVSPSPLPAATITVPAQPPAFTACIAERTAISLSVRMDGVSTTRDIRNATFRFIARSGRSVDTAQLSASQAISQDFPAFFNSSSGYFRYLQTFDVQGDSADIGAVAITLENAKGVSAPVTAATICSTQ